MRCAAATLIACSLLAFFVRICLAGTFSFEGFTDSTGAPNGGSSVIDPSGEVPSKLSLEGGRFSLNFAHLGWQCSHANSSLPCARTSPFEQTGGLTVEAWVDMGASPNGAIIWALPGSHTDVALSGEGCFCRKDALSVSVADGAFSFQFVELHNSKMECNCFKLVIPSTEEKIMLSLSVYSTDVGESEMFIRLNEEVLMRTFNHKLVALASQSPAPIVVSPNADWHGTLFKLSVLNKRVSRQASLASYLKGVAIRRPLFKDETIEIRTTTEHKLDLTHESPHVLAYTLWISAFSTSSCFKLVVKDERDNSQLITADVLPLAISSSLYVSVLANSDECTDFSTPFIIDAYVKLDGYELQTSAKKALSASSLQIPHVASATDSLLSLEESLLSPLSALNSVPVRSITITRIPSKEVGTLSIVKSGRSQALTSVPVSILPSDTLRFKPLIKVRSASPNLKSPENTELYSSSFDYFATSFAQLTSRVVTRHVKIDQSLFIRNTSISVPNSEGFFQVIAPSQSWLPSGLHLDDYMLVVFSLPAKGRLRCSEKAIEQSLLPYAVPSDCSLVFDPLQSFSTPDIIQYGWVHKFLELETSGQSRLELNPARVHPKPIPERDAASLSNSTLLTVGKWVPLNFSVKAESCEGQCNMLLTVESSSEFVYLRSNLPESAGATVVSESRSRIQLLFSPQSKSLMGKSIEVMGVTIAAVILHTRVDLVDAGAWLGSTSQLQENYSVSISSVASGQVSGGANAFFANSSILLGLLIGVPCFVALVFVLLMCRRRTMRKKQEELSEQKERIMQELKESESLQVSSSSVAQVGKKDAAEVDLLEARIAQLHLQLQAKRQLSVKDMSLP